MKSTVTVIEDENNRERYTFYLVNYLEPELRLTSYEKQFRHSKRHNWRTMDVWDSFGSRNRISRPELPLEVIEKAKNNYKKIIEKAEVK